MENNENHKLFSIEEASILAGNGHSYQSKSLLIIFAIVIFTSFSFQVSPMYFYPPKLKCSENFKEKNCNNTFLCQNESNYNFSIIKENNYKSLAYNFDLICSKSIIFNIFNDISLFGASLGSLFYSLIQNNKGILFLK